ncbi:hypothetical protein [Chitinophaga qingshengii]|uniref:Uncharacterized protein n=1 Tax=Chitinophaga qingshengii TaxID=1569794 RepID=A0ABR7TMU6_9BACT|nr:hypothetical protein [Chitinophaga qingshengii]MBC9931804.1 hypothetical protein [Chitinophaga qingshengii]
MMKKSENAYDWLGAGYYFWQSNYKRALDFAQHPPGKRRYDAPAVLGAVVSLHNCLDLSDNNYIDLVRLSYQNLKRMCEEDGTELPENKNVPGSNDRVLRELDCRVVENVHEMIAAMEGPPFDSVRGVFTEGGLLYDGAGFYEKTHIQICIRNPNCIKGFFLPRGEASWP